MGYTSAFTGQDIDKDLSEVGLILYDQVTFLRHACYSSCYRCFLDGQHT
jgi:hypothetical protein